MGRFINHLPMAQLALYRMTGDLDRVEAYSAYFANHFSVDPLQSNYPAVESIDACIGKRDFYEPCLDLVNEAMASQGVEQIVKQTLKIYPMGISSGVFHSLIRLGYAVEGYRLKPESTNEVARALAYYLTAYREAKTFSRQLDRSAFSEEMNSLTDSAPIQRIIQSKSSLGQRLKALYGSDEYLRTGFVVNGDEEDKARGLLDHLIPLFNRTHDIVVLHCITGLHAAFMLKEYFLDFANALDILTTCITTHILAAMPRDRFDRLYDTKGYSWDELLEKGSASKDVHTLKLTYSCHQLYQVCPYAGLKEVALNKIE
jgi:hypothetical protein